MLQWKRFSAALRTFPTIAKWISYGKKKLLEVAHVESIIHCQCFGCRQLEAYIRKQSKEDRKVPSLVMGMWSDMLLDQMRSDAANAEGPESLP